MLTERAWRKRITREPALTRAAHAWQGVAGVLFGREVRLCVKPGAVVAIADPAQLARELRKETKWTK